MPWCPLTYKITVYACKILTKHTQTDTNGMRQARQDGPGDKFPPGRPHIQASSALLCPQAFPDWPIEWVTYPDSNTLWQRGPRDRCSLPLAWCRRGDGVPCAHSICVYEDRGRGRQREKLNAWLVMLGGRKEEQQWVRVVAVVVVEGCKKEK